MDKTEARELAEDLRDFLDERMANPTNARVHLAGNLRDSPCLASRQVGTELLLFLVSGPDDPQELCVEEDDED